MGFLESLPTIPMNADILAIIAAQVRGSYRCVHHAYCAHVRIGPTHEGATITIHASVVLQLMDETASTLQLHGLGESRDFAVIRDGGASVCLREMPWRLTALDLIDPVRRVDRLSEAETRAGHRLISRVPASARPTPRAVTPDVGYPKAAPPTPLRLPPVVPQPAPTPAPVKTLDLSIPESWRAFCVEHDVHPEQRHYVVIPETTVIEAGDARPWIVRSPHVTEVQVVKPRLEGS